MSFSFKQFTIEQSKTAMKVGTDGVLLGAWCDLPSNLDAKILDIGTGTGLIAIMAAQRSPLAVVDAIEIDKMAFEQAVENSQKSPFSSRINIYHISLQNYSPVDNYLYDTIICNPPFFVNSLKNPDSARSTARHTDTLSFNDLITHSFRLLKDNGILSVILPTVEGNQFIELAKSSGFIVTRTTNIHPTVGAETKRLLIELQKNSVPISIEERHLTIEISRHQYTEEYIALTRDFYLKH